MHSPNQIEENNESVMEFETMDAFDANKEDKDFVSPLIKKQVLNDDDEI